MQALYRAICTIDNIDKYMLYIKITNYQKSEINVMLKILHTLLMRSVCMAAIIPETLQSKDLQSQDFQKQVLPS